MSYITDTSGMPRIFSYDDAVKIEANIKPIRGRKDVCKPLSRNRRKQYVNIRREGETVVVRMYSTDILTFCPDGRLIVQFNGWNTMSTREVIGHVTGVWFHTQRGNLFCNVPQHGFDIRDDKNRRKVFKVDCNQPIEFCNTQYGYPFSWALVDPKPYVIHKINRQRKAAIMREFKPFVAYLDRMVRLRDGELRLALEEKQQAWGLGHIGDHLDIVRDPQADHEAMYNAMLALWKQGRSYNMTFDALKRQLSTAVLSKYRDDVFDAIEVENGQGLWDRYGNLF